MSIAIDLDSGDEFEISTSSKKYIVLSTVLNKLHCVFNYVRTHIIDLHRPKTGW